MAERVILLGLDFGSTTSSALVASAVVSSSATGRLALNDVKIECLCEPVLTPFAGHAIDIEKITFLIQNWLKQSGINIDAIFSGGSMITGLAAQAENAAALSKIITSIVGESVIATADDPCLESWLAFMGNCGALSRHHAYTPLLNLDIGGGTTNIALGLRGDVLQTGCYFIGARHFQFEPGGYQITAMSNYGEALLKALNIKKIIGETLSVNEREKIISFYISALEAIFLGNTNFFNTGIAKKHCQVAIQIAPKIKAKLTFSGGVGELLYKISAGETLPSTTYFGDFGIDLALAISRSATLSADLKNCVPEHKGRATVVGLTLHSTEISGNTVYLPRPDCLPLHDVPIIAKLAASSSAEEWRAAFGLLQKRKQGACIQITACNNTLEQVRALATQIKYALQPQGLSPQNIPAEAGYSYVKANKYEPSQPIVILLEANIGKALGNYISNWGQLDYNLIVIDEVALRDAHFVHIGCAHQGMIPVSFYGLH